MDLAGGPSREKLVFVHVPRTGGITLRTVLERQYGRSRTLRLYGDAAERPLDKLERLSAPGLARIQVFAGHVPFGLHRVVPGPIAYVTMLRQPVDRILSHFSYAVERRRSPLHREIHERNLDLEGYLTQSSVAKFVNNGQVSYLAGEVWPESRPATTDTLRRALENLGNRIRVAGLVECFDETLLLMKRLFGWDWPLYEPLNGTRDKSRFDEVPLTSRRLIEQLNALDIELYKAAEDLFETQVREQGSSFQGELDAFKQLNDVLVREDG